MGMSAVARMSSIPVSLLLLRLVRVLVVHPSAQVNDQITDLINRLQTEASSMTSHFSAAVKFDADAVGDRFVKV